MDDLSVMIGSFAVGFACGALLALMLLTWWGK